ncbi:MAG: IS66 family transposase [Candidatus Omnitrophota bacterium]
MCLHREDAEKIYDSGKEFTVNKILALDTENDALKLKIAQLSKNSSNSSKPPSSDIVKPPKKTNEKGGKKNKIGGQPGHPRNERPLFSEAEIDHKSDYHLDKCPECSSADIEFLPEFEPKVLQQVELKEKPFEIFEHRSYAYWCNGCGKIHYAPFPPEAVKEGLFKERLSALVCTMKYSCNASYSNIRKFLADVFGPQMKVSDGYLAKIIQKGSNALKPSYQQLLNYLPSAEVVNVDETGHKENKEKYWTWVFRADLFALFKIEKSRGSDVLIEVLGKEFDGVLGCDFYSSYKKYMRVFNIVIQFCMAHLIREVKFLAGLPDKETSKYGERLLNGLKELFSVIHKRETMSKKAFDKALQKAKKKILRVGKYNVPNSREAKNMARRFKKFGKAYFEFITTPGIGPTNNIAEQAIRFIVIYRRVSQGTRSIVGRTACERFWTVVGTCSLQGKSVFEFIKKTFHAYFYNEPAPLLMPDTS